MAGQIARISGAQSVGAANTNYNNNGGINGNVASHHMGGSTRAIFALLPKINPQQVHKY